MKFGVNLINFGPSAAPESLARWAMLTETLGYHFLMTSDHIAITPDVQARYPAPLYEPFTTLGWLAGVTRRIEIGSTVVILPYRQPVGSRAHGGERGPAQRRQAALRRRCGLVTARVCGAGRALSAARRANRMSTLPRSRCSGPTTWPRSRVATWLSRRCTRRRDPSARPIRRSGLVEPVTRPCAGPSGMAMPGIRTAYAPAG